MIRPQRRWQDRERQQRDVASDQLAAELQDFTAGTILAAGALGVLAEHCPDPDHALNGFVIVLDSDRAFTVEPKLRRLFQIVEGTPSAGLAGRVSWSALAGRNPVAKLRLRIEQPLQLRAEFLLMADRFTGLWPALTREHSFGIALRERLPTTPSPDTVTGLADVLSRSVMIPAEPSATIAHHLIAAQGWPTTVAPDITLVRDLPDAEPDDVVYWLLLDRTHRSAPQAVVAWTHSGVAADVLDGTGCPRDGLVDYWIQRGLSRGGEPPTRALGWTASVDQRAGIFTIRAGDHELALTGSFDPVGERDWVDAVHRNGELVVLVGRLAPEGEDVTPRSVRAALAGDDVARGIVRLVS